MAWGSKKWRRKEFLLLGNHRRFKVKFRLSFHWHVLYEKRGPED
jgi:hypothetical protein